MTRMYFAGQEDFGNRGCEALVRSIISVIRTELDQTEFIVPSVDIARDAAQWPQHDALNVRFAQTKPFVPMIRWWARAGRTFPAVQRAWLPTPTFPEPMRSDILGSDVMIVTGGDTLSLDYGLGSLLKWVSQVETALKANKTVVLWGSSSGPFSANPKVERMMAGHLAKYHLITVRESDTLGYLTRLGLRNVELVADPAFVLEPQPVATPLSLPTGAQGILGFNISPLITKFREGADSVAKLEADIVGFWRWVLDATSLDIVLVPHVDPLNGSSENSDSAYMSKLLAQFGGANRRIALLPRTLNAAELKHVISGCRYFMGARTHSTIAAMSSGVPTISIAYSVKAKGLNRDLFGDLRYVVETPAVSLETLKGALQSLQAEESSARTLLSERIPEWRIRARRTGLLLRALLTSAAARRVS